MDNQPLVSIIVPCYNQAQYLPEALDSVLAQTYQNWECVIVNDGSPDNTDQVAKEYCSRDNRFKYLKQDNQGVSTARNNGIRQSHGEYILPLDGDDLLEASYIEKVINYFGKFPNTKLVYCYAETFGVEKSIIKPPLFVYSDFIWGSQIFNYAVYKRNDYDSTSGYNPNMKYGLEDWDFFLSLINKEDKVFCIKEVLYYYRKTGESRSDNVSFHSQESLRTLYENHRELYYPYLSNIVFLNNEMCHYKNRCIRLEKELKRLRSTKSYKLGKFLLKPFSALVKKYHTLGHAGNNN